MPGCSRACRVRALLVLNKTTSPIRGEGVTHDCALQRTRLSHVPASVHTGIELLLAELRVTSACSSAIGVGKSTLVNRLVPEANARLEKRPSAVIQAATPRREPALSHRHPNRNYRLTGMHAFGLNHLNPADLANAFIESAASSASALRQLPHDGEPGCAVDSAVKDGRILAERLSNYRRILKSIDETAPGNRRSCSLIAS